MKLPGPDVSSIQNIPGYVEILKYVLKAQIQSLVVQLQEHAGEETLVLSANLTAGTTSHLGSNRGQGFLEVRDDIKSQFLTHCLQGKQKYHTAQPPGSKERSSVVMATSHAVTTTVIQPGTSMVTQQGIQPETKSLNTLLAEKQISPSLISNPGCVPVTQPDAEPRVAPANVNIATHSSNSTYPGLTTLPAVDPAMISKIKELLSSLTTQSLQLVPPAQIVGQTVNSSASAVSSVTATGNVARTSGLHITTTENSISVAGNSLYTTGIPVMTARSSTLVSSTGITGIPVAANANSAGIPTSGILMSTSGNLNKIARIPTTVLGISVSAPEIHNSTANTLTTVPGLSMSAPIIPIAGTNTVLVPVGNANSTLNMPVLPGANLVPLSNIPLLNNITNVSFPLTQNTSGKPIYGVSLLKGLTNVNGDKEENTVIKIMDASGKSNEQSKKGTSRKRTAKSSGSQLESKPSPKTPLKRTKTSDLELSDNFPQAAHVISGDSDDKETACCIGSLTTINANDLKTSLMPGLQQIELILSSNHSSVMSQKIFVDTPIKGKTGNMQTTADMLDTRSFVKSIQELSNQTLNNESKGKGKTSKSSPVKASNVTVKSPLASDSKEKDKSKKTLSSKIDEITQRIKKDDSQKLHTVQHEDMNSNLDNLCKVASACLSSPLKVGSVIGIGETQLQESVSNTSAGNMDVGSPDNVTTHSDHLGDDPSKLKDGSRASHRKPKLPRFNIGVASDDEDNSDSVEISLSPSSVSPESTVPSLSLANVGVNNMDSSGGLLAAVTGSPDPADTTPSSSLYPEMVQDITIHMSNDDSDASFPPINFDEIADSLLLTDLPNLGYLNSSDEPNRSFMESVYNMKSGRDPNSKKPLNAQSVIVCGSKQEKDWVKCPLCPDKFQTVEALQYHIKNINHVIKKFSCDLCGRKFSALRDAERHRRIHTGEKPFKCEICNKQFSRKDNLKSHVKKHGQNSQD